jgi:hypothetical protein
LYGQKILSGTEDHNSTCPFLGRRRKGNSLKKKPKNKYHAERTSKSLDNCGIIVAISS